MEPSFLADVQEPAAGGFPSIPAQSSPDRRSITIKFAHVQHLQKAQNHHLTTVERKRAFHGMEEP